MWFDGWDSLLRILVSGVVAYAGLVLLLRISGKRTLSKMNAFDFVVTVAFGSILASMLLSKDVTLTEGLTGFGVLIGLQYVVAWLSVRFPFVERVVKATPSLLVWQGRMVHDTLRRERVTTEEVHAAVREAGYAGLEAVEAVVLETDGQISVVASADATPPNPSLQMVKGYRDVS